MCFGQMLVLELQEDTGPGIQSSLLKFCGMLARISMMSTCHNSEW